MAALISLLNLNQENFEIPEINLKNSFDNNEGVGMVVSKKGKLIVRKTSKSFEKFYNFYKNNFRHPGVIFFPKSPYSDAAGNKHNAKMFILTENLVVFHEGYLTGLATNNFWKPQRKRLTAPANKSLMQALVEKVFRPAAQFDENIFKQKSFQVLIEKLCDWDDKLVFLYNTGESVIFNKDKGKDLGGIWYSNNDFERTYTHYNSFKSRTIYPGGSKKIVLQQQGPPESRSHFIDQESDDDLSKYYQKAASEPDDDNYDGDDKTLTTEEEQEIIEEEAKELLGEGQHKINFEDREYDLEEEMRKFYGFY